MMKVAFITVEYPPFLKGGAGNYAYNLTRELTKLGHEIHVITPTMGASARESIEEGVFLHRIDVVNRPFLEVFSFWLSLRKNFHSLEHQVGGFDIVHDNGLSGFSLSRKVVAAPRVVTIHHLARTTLKTLGGGLVGRLKNIRGESGISPLIEPVCIRRADQIVAVSQFTRQDIIDVLGIPESRIEVIYHGVHPDEFVFTEKARSTLRDTLGIGSKPMILFVGNLFPRKGVDTLLKALPQVLKEIDVKLVLAGAGDLPAYRQLAQTLGISEKLHFLGRVPDDNLRLLYASCDLFVLPSRLEGLGIVILEAMAAGKPVVATNVGGIPELIESGHNGILVEAGKEALAGAIVKLLSDNSLAHTIGHNNIQKVRQFYSWEIAARKTENLYSKLIKK